MLGKESIWMNMNEIRKMAKENVIYQGGHGI